MSDKNKDVNGDQGFTTLAPIQNVFLLSRALQQAIDRPPHLPNMVCFSGPSGWGKSTAAVYAMNKFKAYYVECKSSWNKRAVLENILKEMGIVPEKVIWKMTDQVSHQLVRSRRPLIIDELDHLVEKKAVELVRDIADSSNTPILLIGEENIDTKLRKWERVHNRVMAWELAQPASIEDVKHLAKLYCEDVAIAPDLLDHIRIQSGGVTRYICININRVRQEALNQGLDKIDRKAWADKILYTGEAPARMR